MSNRYLQALDVILGNEGGLSDHEADRGGRTNLGITQKNYDAFRKASGKPPRPVDEINGAEVEEFYAQYWKDAHCGYMPEPLDLQVFDAAVNHGAGRAIKLLQRVLGTDEDGIAGRQTMDALHADIVAFGVSDVCLRYLKERQAFYDRIIERDPSQAVFARGWENRIDHMRAYV